MKRLSFFLATIFCLLFVLPAFAGIAQYRYDQLNRLIKAEYANGLTIEYTYDEAGNRISKTVTQQSSISGRVTTSDGQPLENVCMSANSLCGDTFYGGSLTDANGNYAFVIPAGDYYIQTQASCITPQNYLDEWWDGGEGTTDCQEAAPVTVTEGQMTSEINFSLIQGGTISGTVYQGDGSTPIGDVCVMATDLYGGTWYGGSVTDAEGHYSFAIPVGEYYIKTDASCITPREYVNQCWNNDGEKTIDCQNATPVQVTAGQTTSGIDLSLVQGGTISGAVYQSDGSTPITNVCVNASVVCGGNWYGGSVTDENGNYSFVLPEGNYYIQTLVSCITPQDYTNEWWDNGEGATNCQEAALVNVSTGQTTSEINFSLMQGSTISGTVSTSDGQPLAKVCVNASSLCGETWYGGGQTDENGNYSFSVPAGDYYTGATQSTLFPVERGSLVL